MLLSLRSFGFLLGRQNLKKRMEKYVAFFKRTEKNAVPNPVNRQKRPKWRFWRSITFFCVFKNTNDKSICASLVFLAESRPKHDETIFWGVFYKNQKRTFSGVQNGTFKKTSFKVVFLCLFFNVKGSSMPIFIKKILIFGPPGICWKWKLWRTLEFGISSKVMGLRFP